MLREREKQRKSAWRVNCGDGAMPIVSQENPEPQREQVGEVLGCVGKLDLRALFLEWLYLLPARTFVKLNTRIWDNLSAILA